MLKNSNKSKNKRMEAVQKRKLTQNLGLRRLAFALSTIPTIINLLAYALFISKLQIFLIILAGVSAVYFLLVFFFEIKAGEWSIFSFVCTALASVLASLFFILAYKLYLWFIAIAIEIALIVFIYVKRNRLFGL